MSPDRLLAGAITSRTVRSKGDRTQMNTRQPRVLADAAEAEATRRGITLTDYIGQLLAGDLGIPYDTQEELPLPKSA